MATEWFVDGAVLRPFDSSQKQKALKPHHYLVGCDTKGFFLNPIAEAFSMPEKVYGANNPFIERVVKVYGATKTNLGILLNGIKGTGKTVSCQLICEELSSKHKLPVIIVTTDYDGLSDFLGTITQDCIIFFDEFEKTFNHDRGGSKKLLTVMDGVLKSKYRKLFLLTTNETRIDDNLLQRPGRIRYIQNFRNIAPDVVTEIIADRLEKPEYQESLITAISQLELVTVDIVISLIDEINIFDQQPEEFLKIFNVKKNIKRHNIFLIVKDEKTGLESPKLVMNNKTVTPLGPFDESHVFTYLRIGGDYTGIIEEIVDDETVRVRYSGHDEEDEADAESICFRGHKSGDLITVKIESTVFTNSHYAAANPYVKVPATQPTE